MTKKKTSVSAKKKAVAKKPTKSIALKTAVKKTATKKTVKKPVVKKAASHIIKTVKKPVVKKTPVKKFKKILKKLSVKTISAPKATKVVKTSAAAPRFGAWSVSICVYWFIILFFISATFYILGRSHGILNPVFNNVEITEQGLMQSDDYVASGKAKLLSGEIYGAIEDFDIALTAKDPSPDAYLLRGEAYMQIGEYIKAMESFDTVIAMDPNNSIAYYDRALLNARIEDYTSALADVNNALAARAVLPNNVLQLRDIYAKRGQLNLWLKNWEGAIADYTNSLAFPDGIIDPMVYAERAEAFTATGRYSEAAEDYMTAIRVISEQIQGASNSDARELLSRRAMEFFEKSAALNVRMGDLESGKSDLESAYTIAIALNDADTMERLRSLILEM